MAFKMKGPSLLKMKVSPMKVEADVEEFAKRKTKEKEAKKDLLKKEITKNQPKKKSGPDWSKAPKVGTQARRDWYTKNNLKQDETTRVKTEVTKVEPKKVTSPKIDTKSDVKTAKVTETKPKSKRELANERIAARRKKRREKLKKAGETKVGKEVKKFGKSLREALTKPKKYTTDPITGKRKKYTPRNKK